MKNHFNKAFLGAALAVTVLAAGVASAQVIAQPVVSACTVLNYNMGYESRDYYTQGGVTKLQTYLYTQGVFPYTATGFYGALTARAVATWQSQHGISAIGIVGPLTRAAIQQASCNGGVVPPTVVSLQQAYPSQGPVGTTFTLVGTGFTQDSVFYFANGSITPTSLSANSATFTIPSYIGPYCKPGNACALWVREVTPGAYNIYVQNSNGTSNTIVFTVTGATTKAAPVIYTEVPTSGPLGTTVSLTGFGFDATNNTVMFGNGAIVHVPVTGTIAVACTTDPTCHGGIRQTLTFTVPSTLNPLCYYSTPNCLVASTQTTPGSYNVSVQNSNGTSNSVTFTVTGGTTNAQPVIQSLNPSTGAVGTQVTIQGLGFVSGSTVYFEGSAIPSSFVPTTSSGNAALFFTVPNSIGANCQYQQVCPMYARLITPGTYTVSVTNQNGTSNTANFTVTQ